MTFGNQNRPASLVNQLISTTDLVIPTNFKLANRTLKTFSIPTFQMFQQN